MSSGASLTLLVFSYCLSDFLVMAPAALRISAVAKIAAAVAVGD